MNTNDDDKVTAGDTINDLTEADNLEEAKEAVKRDAEQTKDDIEKAIPGDSDNDGK